MKEMDSYTKLAQFGRELLGITSLELGLPIISDYAKSVMHADRCSIFIYEKNKNIVWSTLSDGIEKITLQGDEGIVGQTIQNKEPIIVNDTYNNTNFLQKVDHKSGYVTSNIASVPIFDSMQKVIGVLQLLNKCEGDFNDKDTRFMIFFSHYISGYLELATIFREDEDEESEDSPTPPLV